MHKIILFMTTANQCIYFLLYSWHISSPNTEMATVEAIEDLEGIETPQVHCAGDQSGKASQPVGENGRRKETLPDASSEGETDRITELADKTGSTLDPVTMDQALLQSLRQKYQ